MAINSSNFAYVIRGTDPEATRSKTAPHKDWKTERSPWSIEQIAEAVGNAQERAIGIYPERQIRWLVIDIDAKQGSKSPYWDEYGQNLYLQALEAAVADVGCRSILTRSSTSKGLHLLILLPAMQPTHLVHHMGQELVARAGMTVQDGICEIFPSEVRWVPGFKTKGRCSPRSKGVRLPGGKGSALIVDGALVTDPQSIWEEILNELDNTEATPAWDALVADAQVRVDEQFRVSRRRKSRYGKRSVSMPGPWTGRHQSMAIVEKITRVADAELAGSPDHVIVDRAVELIQQHPGFDQFASVITKRRVRNGSWPQQWLDVWTRKGQRQAEDHPDRVRDPDHNHRLRGETMAKLTAAVAEHGEALLELSERAAAAMLQMTRDTWRKVRKLVPDLLRSELVDPPSIKALHQNLQAEGTGCSRFESFDSAVSVPPVAPAEQETVGVHLQEQKPTHQDGFSSKFARNLASLRDQCGGLFKRKRRKFTPIDPGEGKRAAKAERDARSPLPAWAPLEPVILTPDERRARERAELEAWINSA